MVVGYVVLKVVHGYAVAHGVEDEGGYAGAQKDEPGAVFGQVAEVFFQVVFLLFGWGDALAGPRKGEQEKAYGDAADDDHGELVGGGQGYGAGKEIDHGLKQGYDQQTAAKGEDHAVGGEAGALVAVGGHYAEQTGVGYVNGGVGHHHKGVGDVGVNDFALQVELGCGEEEYAYEGEGSGYPQQVGAKFAPAGVGAVANDAHKGVVGGVPNAGDQKHGAGGCGGYAKYVGVKNGEVKGEDFPEHGGGGVAESVSDFFFEADFLGLHHFQALFRRWYISMRARVL